MAIGSSRFLKPFSQLANVIRFPNPTGPVGPTFAGKTPQIQTPPTVEGDNRPFDLFRTTAPRTARIVLRPASSLKTELERKLEEYRLRRLSSPNWPSFPSRTQGVLLGMLFAALEGKPLDEMGNHFALYQSQPVNRTRLKQVQSDEERVALHEATGRANLRTLLNTVQNSLNALPGNISEVTIELPPKLPDGVTREDLARELAELATLNGYNHNYFRQNSRPSAPLKSIVLNKPGMNHEGVQAAIREGQLIGQAMNLTRHLVDAPANVKTPKYISDEALKLKSGTLDVQIHEKDFIEGKTPGNDKRMGLFLSVAQGNDPNNPDKAPRLAEMVYTPKGWDPETGKTVLLVGKGIVFDTGGNNLKAHPDYIHGMKGDMAGAAAVIGAMKALDEAQLGGVRVVGLTPLTENRLGSAASLPRDAYIARNGKSVEIGNTDAEGRLILADALHYGVEKYQPDAMATIATLTGGKVRAVGAQNAVAISGNNLPLMKAVDRIEKGMHRKTAVLPLTNHHHNWVTRGGKGLADAYNSVGMDDAKRFGVISPHDADPLEPSRQHSAQGAAFIREFIPKGQEQTPWVHYDIAGAELDKPAADSGEEWATGFGVKELYYLVKGLAEGTLQADPQDSRAAKER